MARREWSRPFPEIRMEILNVLADGQSYSSDQIVERTGLPFEDVISALRMLRHKDEIDFEPVWEGEGVMRGARGVRLRPPGATE